MQEIIYSISIQSAGSLATRFLQSRPNAQMFLNSGFYTNPAALSDLPAHLCGVSNPAHGFVREPTGRRHQDTRRTKRWAPGFFGFSFVSPDATAPPSSSSYFLLRGEISPWLLRDRCRRSHTQEHRRMTVRCQHSQVRCASSLHHHHCVIQSEGLRRTSVTHEAPFLKN